MLKKKQIEEHNNIRPPALPKPSEQLSGAQQQAATALEEIAAKLKALEHQTIANASAQASIAAKSKAIQSLRERLRTLERQYKQFQDDTAKDLAVLGLDLPKLVTLSINQLAVNLILSCCQWGITLT